MLRTKLYFKIVVSLVFILLFVVLIVKKHYNPFINASDDIFTVELADKLLVIHFWYGDTKIIINNNDDIKSIFNKLADLKIKKTPPDAPKKEGAISIELVTHDKIIKLAFLSDTMIYNGNRYYMDTDVLPHIREIALKYFN